MLSLLQIQFIKSYRINACNENELFEVLKVKIMILRLFLVGIIFSTFSLLGQTICNQNGNLAIFSNYDGGIVNIDVDQNIPNLVIAICTYEPVQVTITGAFAGNVVQVIYAGFNSTQNNNNCGQGNFITSISGVPA